ncbi:MAG TPA: hypothetical protein VN635_04340 [Conexibacter sp.]|nr:hypothetical protein [Conexibacter sp.]
MSISIRTPAPLAIAEARFDLYHYDSEADVLYLHVDGAADTADWDGTHEGHGVRFDADGKLIHATLVNAAWLLDREGALDVTPRDGSPTTRLPRELIEPLLVETLRYAS